VVGIACLLSKWCSRHGGNSHSIESAKQCYCL